jgi:hypothetical protein
MHRRNQHHTFFDAALLYDGFDLGRDVNVLAVFASMKVQVFGVEFHQVLTLYQSV